MAGSSWVIILKWASDLFQNFLSRHVPALNSPGNQDHFWSLGGSKMFETRYLLGSKIITHLDPGHETSALSVQEMHRTLGREWQCTGIC
jgi:hypothetical protein